MARGYHWAVGVSLAAAAVGVVGVGVRCAGPARPEDRLPPAVVVEASGPEHAAIRAVTEQKSALARALLRGELSLDRAVAGFRALDARPPDTLRTLRRLHPAATADELSGWQVIEYARQEARLDPALAAGLPAVEAAYRRRFPAGLPAGDRAGGGGTSLRATGVPIDNR